MKKIGALLAFVGLLCVSLSSLAGEVITNDTGDDATGLRVVFSEMVQITAFGDTLMQVDPTGIATEFVFSGGTVSPWGSHWMSWTPAAASILNHQWLHGGEQGIRKSVQELPSTTVTQFPPVVQTEAAVDSETPYRVIPVDEYSPQDELPVDGMSSGSVPLNWWYSFDRTDSGPKFHGLEPVQKDGERFVRYTYPDDGDVRTLTSQFTDTVDASSYEALVIVARADHAINTEINLGYYDHNLPATENGEPCESSAAVFATEIPLDQQERVYVLPLTAFDVNSWAIVHKPGASTDPNLKELLEFKITPDDEGTIEILRVAFAKTMPKAVTTGNPPVINDYYFKQPAYVMQGVGDTDGIYALPLKGIPELGTGYVAEDADGGELTWSVTTSDPGIGAGFQDERLYIWGADANWSGYGEATLTVADAEDMSDSITIPVTVFRDDKTLVNAEGKKDYFVPWSPELDINRILSVEEHMRKYNKDEGNLDCSIQWSPWRKMEYRKDVDFITLWFNSSIPWAHGWNESAQFALVDVLFDELKRLGVNGIRLRDIWYFKELTGTELFPIYDKAWFGVTRHPHETSYIVNEAHRHGMSVVLGNAFFPHVVAQPYELFNANPTPRADFYTNVAERDRASLHAWSELGVDIVDLGTQIETINEATHTWAEAKYIDKRLSQMADDARDIYPGPLYHAALPFGGFFPGKSQFEAEFWKHFDILGSGVMALRVTPYSDPTLEQLIDGWRRLIHDYHQPFQERYNKPLLAYENGCLSVKGCVNWGAYGGDCFAADAASKPLSIADTRLWYISQDKAFNEMEGYFGPGWHFYAFDPGAVGSIRDRSTNPRLKVEDIIQNLFLGEVTRPLIQIDGSILDWSDKYIVALDPIEDLRDQNDLRELSFTQDDSYLYFRVDYTAPPSGDLRIELDVDGDLRADLHLDLANQYSPDGTWWGNSYIYTSDQLRVGFVDSIDVGSSIELRVPKRFLQGILNEEYLGVRLKHYDRFWDLGDETQWVTLWGKPLVPSSSMFESLDCGSVTADKALALTGEHSILGEYWGNHSFVPYLRTVQTSLPLSPQGRYQVCFDYRIIESNSEGFEVLFFSPTGAGEANWVPPLRLYGTNGKLGRGCLEARLHDYTDYEIRWNVVSTGKIVIDNIVVRDVSTNQIITEEDFEAWR